MFRGSEGLSADQLSLIIAAMGGEFNADTQQTVTQYFLTVPSENLDIALRIEAARMKDVSDSQKLWQQERGALEQEVAQDMSNPEYLLYSGLLERLFADTPYARDALGTRPSFRAMTGSMLKKFHRQWYGPNNAVLVIAGDVEHSETIAKVRLLFEGIPPRPVPARKDIVLRPLKPGTILLETDLPYGIGVVAFRLPGYDSPDFAAAQILADILDSRRGNIYALVPNGKALSAGFTFDPLPRAGIGYALAAFPQNWSGQAIVTALKDIISDYLKDGSPADLVEASKRHETADAELQMNSLEGVASAWSQAIAVEGRHSPEDDIEAIKKVTVEDVNRVAKTYLNNDTAVTAILTPKPAGKAVTTRSFRGKESFTPEKVSRVALPTWARKLESLPSAPTDEGKTFSTVLPNGLRLIVRPEEISRTVSVYGGVKNNPDIQTPKGEEGVAEVLEALFPYGTQTLDRLQFQKKLDDIPARLTSGTRFSLQVPAEGFERGIQLLADNLLHPAFSADAFRVVQQQLKDDLVGRLKSPSYLADRSLRMALYPPDDPTLRQAVPDSVAALTLDSVKNYHREVFRPDMTTIVVVGMMEPQRAREVISKYFGDWTPSGPKPETDLPRVPLNEPSAIAVPDPTRVQAGVTLAETLSLRRKDPEYYTLQLGRHVLSGAFYATRLYRDLREKSGLVYSVDAFLEAGKKRGLFGITYACDPDKVSTAHRLIEKDLFFMQKQDVTSAELRQAKTLLIRQITLSRSSIDGIGEALLSLALEDLPLDEPLIAAHHYLETSAAEVRSAFSRWIRPAGFVQVTLGPTPR